jgi:hypothetical protein
MITDIKNYINKNYNSELLKLSKHHNNINFTNYLQNKISENEKHVSDSETVYSDDFIFKKNWSKLHLTHKIIKIKQYVNSKIQDKLKKKEVNDKLTVLVKTKKLLNKDVYYDVNNAKIIKIKNYVF